ncbi:MAG: threonylcarbamoyl-AMP synthase [Gammaproteobacteria bacterium]|nr:threonylcarbamoyl-AMP synthase [Gammaproteobacteria bacterium]
MSQFFQIHPDNPQPRLINQAVEIIRQGGVLVYPTDSGYALGCHIGDKSAMERIRTIRKLSEKHNFTLVCRDLSQVSQYAKVGNIAYRLIKAITPGAYTFILPATREVPRRLQHIKRKTIGLRIPDNAIAQAIVDALGEALMSVSLILPGDDYPMSDPYDIRDQLEHAVDLVIDGGYCGIEATTIVDLEDEIPVVLRRGAGDTSVLELA